MTFSAKKLGVLVLAAAFCCGFYGMAQAKDGKGASRYLEQLSPGQREQARGIFEEARNSNRELRETIRARREQLAEMMKSANPDVAAVEALCKEIGQLRGNEGVARLAVAEKLKQAGLPEMTKPARPENRPDMKKGDAEEFAARRIARLPQEKQAEAKKIFDEYQAARGPLREELKAKRAELEQAEARGDATNVAALSEAIGELKGKTLAAKIGLRRNLEKNGIPADAFDRDGKKGGKRDGKGERKKDGKREKRERKAD